MRELKKQYSDINSRMPRHSCCEVRVMQLHDILLLRTSAILPEAISAGGLTPTTDTSLFLTTYRGGSHLPTDILFSLIELGCKEHTNALENLYEYDKQYNSYDHNTCLIAVISVTNGNITKSATADTTCHCRISKNGSDCDSCSGK